MREKVVVLGGGVMGVSTALACRSMGYKVELISHRFLWENTTDPAFASVYPAASVIPHSVGGDTQSLYQLSHSVYNNIARLWPEVVRPQVHLEIGEEKRPLPGYAEWMGAQPITENPALPIPSRIAAAHVFGVQFDILFVDMPRYISFLKKAVQQAGISTMRKEITQDMVREAGERENVICNCLGLYGPSVSEDESSMHGVAGILVRFPQKKLLRNARTNTPISYNYFFKGLEVYAYPRARDLVFGGIRLPVDVNKDSVSQLSAHFETHDISYSYIQDVPVPDYLIEVNKRFTHQLYGVDVSVNEAKAVVGIRPVRRDGVRIDKVDLGEGVLVNNYGYGGAGVTLAWGGAIKAASLVSGKEMDTVLVDTVLQKIMDVF